MSSIGSEAPHALDHVFLNKHGTPYSKDCLVKKMARLRDRAGIEAIRILGIVMKDSPVMSWLAEIGKLLFMFFVGFEIDLELFKKTKNRSLAFGLLTFTIPLLAGILLGRTYGYSWMAIQIACNFAFASGCKRLGSLSSTLAVLCTQQRCSRVFGIDLPQRFPEPQGSVADRQLRIDRQPAGLHVQQQSLPRLLALAIAVDDGDQLLLAVRRWLPSAPGCTAGLLPGGC